MKIIVGTYKCFDEARNSLSHLDSKVRIHNRVMHIYFYTILNKNKGTFVS